MTASDPSAASSQTPLAPAHGERLRIIRYQARQAYEQSEAPMPLATLALNVFQDAAESMLSLIAEHNNIVRRNKTDFDKLFDDMAAKFPDLQPYRAPLLALPINAAGHALVTDVHGRPHTNLSSLAVKGSGVRIPSAPPNLTSILTFSKIAAMRDSGADSNA